MTINIFHYHLKIGGVTQIIQSQIRALQELFPQTTVRLFTGFCPNPEAFEKPGVELIVNPALNYLDKNISPGQARQMRREIEKFLAMHIQPHQIIHAHNPNLGKNPIITAVLAALAHKTYPVLNHAHDFSEDRPENQELMEKIISGFLGENLQQTMYPPLSNYAFATLSLHDRQKVLSQNIPGTRVAWLPNPVDTRFLALASEKKRCRQTICQRLNLDPAKKIVSYPVRAIRRKNIGEFILLATLFEDKAHFLSTRAPQNPQEALPYQKWKQFCHTEQIPVGFEVGEKADFDQLLCASDFCISTSLREGFGMAFLEPWLAGTPVVGRNLPNISPDFRHSGIKFSVLYDAIALPGVPDFKDLSPENQREVIKKAKNNTLFREKIFNNNSFLEKLFAPVPQSLITENKEKIQTQYSPRQFAQKLYEIYQNLV